MNVAVCACEHGAQCVHANMVHSVCVQPWCTVCACEHGAQCVRAIMVHSVCMRTWCTVRACEHGVHTNEHNKPQLSQAILLSEWVPIVM